jgi:hypothetical protein
VELELVLQEEPSKSGGELAAEDTAECADGQEEAGRRATYSVSGLGSASQSASMSLRLPSLVAFCSAVGNAIMP